MRMKIFPLTVALAMLFPDIAIGQQQAMIVTKLVAKPDGTYTVLPLSIAIPGGNRTVNGATCKEELLNYNNMAMCYFTLCKKDGVITSAKLTSTASHKYCISTKRY